jgi:outer membrane receptor protein involved in Fe transport
MLLLSSALVTPAALAQQTGSAPQASPGTQGPPIGAEADAQPGDAQAEQPEEEIEVSAPGVDLTPEDQGFVVIGERGPQSIVRNAPQVLSILSSEDIARTGEGDIAGALQRVTGLSVVGGGFVYVRGLGDRYSLSLLNGSPLPSPEPLRRVVPLDIFPTSIIASALVQKSFSPNYPGEFGGGVINLTTQATPREPFLEISGSIGGDTFTTFSLGYTYFGSDTDILGFDDGTRTPPSFITAAGQSGQVIGSQDATQLANASTTVLQRNRNIPADWSVGVSAGASTSVFGDGELGFIFNAGLSNGWLTREARQQNAGPEGGLITDFTTVLTDNRIVANGLLGIGLEIGEHRFRLTNLYIHDTVKQGRLSSGFDVGVGTEDPNQPDPLIRQGTYFFERELYDLQGVAELDFGDVDLDLRGTYARTLRKSPYERDFSYQYDATIGDYLNRLSGGFETATISFSDLDEQVLAGGADLSFARVLGAPINLTFGYAYTDTKRASTRYTFRYQTPNGNRLSDAVGQLRPDYLLSDFTIVTNNIVLQPLNVGGETFYEADLTVHAGYGMADIDLAEGLLLSGGVRYETATQTVGTGGAFFPTDLENSYFLPAATLTWNFRPDMQLRLHGSRTIARPQFRELAPQQYQDFESDRSFFGNPLLTDSELTNAEARLEWYFGRSERVSLSGFYKKIDNPIEPVVGQNTSAGDILVGFTNAPTASLYGLEFEVQKYIPLDSLGGFFDTRRLLLIGNYTYSKSELSIGDELVFSPIQPLSPDPNNPINLQVPANLVFRDGAPLTGQSEHLVNLQVGIEDTESVSQVTFLVNYASERVTNRGLPGTPDFVEAPGLSFDIVARQGFRFLGSDAELKVEARNLLGEEYTERQTFEDGTVIDINSYERGTRFSASLSFRF